MRLLSLEEVTTPAHLSRAGHSGVLSFSFNYSRTRLGTRRPTKLYALATESNQR